MKFLTYLKIPETLSSIQIVYSDYCIFGDNKKRRLKMSAYYIQLKHKGIYS